jgi:hypothetical protein
MYCYITLQPYTCMLRLPLQLTCTVCCRGVDGFSLEKPVLLAPCRKSTRDATPKQKKSPPLCGGARKEQADTQTPLANKQSSAEKDAANESSPVVDPAVPEASPRKSPKTPSKGSKPTSRNRTPKNTNTPASDSAAPQHTQQKSAASEKHEVAHVHTEVEDTEMLKNEEEGEEEEDLEKDSAYVINPEFPRLPSSVPLTYTLAMVACLCSNPIERPSFAQVRKTKSQSVHSVSVLLSAGFKLPHQNSFFWVFGGSHDFRMHAGGYGAGGCECGSGNRALHELRWACTGEFMPPSFPFIVTSYGSFLYSECREFTPTCNLGANRQTHAIHSRVCC